MGTGTKGGDSCLTSCCAPSWQCVVHRDLPVGSQLETRVRGEDRGTHFLFPPLPKSSSVSPVPPEQCPLVPLLSWGPPPKQSAHTQILASHSAWFGGMGTPSQGWVRGYSPQAAKLGSPPTAPTPLGAQASQARTEITGRTKLQERRERERGHVLGGISTFPSKIQILNHADSAAGTGLRHRPSPAPLSPAPLPTCRTPLSVA